jgi:enoyl-CoA hydratase/carnithine racemase
MPMNIDPTKLERTLYEVSDRIATVTLNHPERLNALDTKMHKELYQIWDDVKWNDDVDVIIITGAGERGFCTGADVREAVEARAAGEQVERSVRGRFGASREGFSGTPIEHDIWKPIICAVNGTCAGGGLHFVWMSDFAICSPNATFLEPHVSVGQVPVREMLGMSRRIPMSYVMRMAYLGTKERINAKKAEQLGIVTEVVESQEALLPRARELAKLIMTNDLACIAATKQLLFKSFDLPLRDAIQYGFSLSGAPWVKADREERSRAFVERRQAEPSAR